MTTALRVADPSIPGLGATRNDWDASHTQNPDFDNDEVFGYDPRLPRYLSANGAVYIAVLDEDLNGTTRIDSYMLNMQRDANRDDALARVRQELPSDLTVAWELPLEKCYRVAFNSPKLGAMQRMALVQLEHIEDNGSLEVNPHTFDQASFTLGTVGASPDPDIDC